MIRLVRGIERLNMNVSTVSKNKGYKLNCSNIKVTILSRELSFLQENYRSLATVTIII